MFGSNRCCKSNLLPRETTQVRSVRCMVLPSIECEKWCRTNHGQKDKLPAAAIYSTLLFVWDGEMEGGYEAESWLRVRLGNPRKYSLDPLGSCPNPTRLKVTATLAGFSGKKTFTFPSSSTRRAVVAEPFGCGSDKRSASLLSKWPRIPQGGAEHEQNPKAQVTKKYAATIGFDISL